LATQTHSEGFAEGKSRETGGSGHEHGGRRGKHHEERWRDRRRLGWALGITAVIALAEAVGGYLTDSLALMSDAGHMVTDVSALALSLLALWFSGRPATIKRTYGYYRLEILSALVNGVALVVLTALIVFEAYKRVMAPAPVKIGPMMVVAAIGLGANILSMYFLHRSRSMNVRGAFLHVIGDALSSVGVLAGGVVMWLTGWFRVDAVISLLIAIVIVVSAFRLVRDAVEVLLESVPPHVDLDAVRTILGRCPGVKGVHDLHVWTISSGLYALSAHLVVEDPTCHNNDTILSAVKHELFDRFGIDHTTIQIESETYAHLGEIH
jgi:cobalt-zinc-cadmium efflux system protein